MGCRRKQPVPSAHVLLRDAGGSIAEHLEQPHHGVNVTVLRRPFPPTNRLPQLPRLEADLRQEPLRQGVPVLTAETVRRGGLPEKLRGLVPLALHEVHLPQHRGATLVVHAGSSTIPAARLLEVGGRQLMVKPPAVAVLADLKALLRASAKKPDRTQEVVMHVPLHRGLAKLGRCNVLQSRGLVASLASVRLRRPLELHDLGQHVREPVAWS
mmetsp:Transcript_72600/g.210142  ORF Transcript_72600/g.210142 Transcript_72600/m.210142 type:complete len:212 (+) Transcript_72600:197-832(+)